MTGRAVEAALPRGTWSADRVREVVDQIELRRLAADDLDLGPGERRAIGHLIAAGGLVGDLYAHQRHRRALASRDRLVALHEALGRPERTRDLLRLTAWADGPVVTTLENRLEPILPVGGWVPGGNVYPWAIGRDEVEAFLAAHPERRAGILGPHTVVRRTSPAALRRDLATLRRHPALAGTHPGLLEDLRALAAAPAREALYAVPYSVAFADRLLPVAAHLWDASLAVGDEDRDLAAFLRIRSRDVLSDDIEAGDAAWTRGEFRRLEVVYGPHDVYDDDLFNVKTSFGFAVLATHDATTAEIRHWVRHLPDIDAGLPYEGERRRPEHVPMATYDVLALFGWARAAAAEILPNDPDHIRRYGRRILIRRNLIEDPLYQAALARRWAAAIAPGQHGDLTAEGNLAQVIGHELAHYLGPDLTLDGRRFPAALGEEADVIEEMKAEVASYVVAGALHRAGEFDSARVRGVLCQLVLGGLRPTPPHRSQPYPTLRTMILNRFLADGVVVRSGDRFAVRHEAAPAAAEALLGEIMRLQQRGSKSEVDAFIDRWVGWGDDNRAIAALVASAERYRFARVVGPLEPDPPGLPGGW